MTADPADPAEPAGLAEAAELARSLRRELRGMRRARHPLSDTLGTGYTVVFTLVVLGSMLVVPLQRAFAARGCAAGCRVSDAGGLAAALAVLTLGVALHQLGAVGPVLASQASSSWVLSTPGDRAVLLRPALRGAAVLAGAAGAVIGAALALLGRGGPVTTLLAGAAGLAAGVAAAGLSALAQQRGRVGLVRRVGDGLLAVGAVGLLTALGVRGWAPPVPPRAVGQAVVLALVVLAVLAVSTGRRGLGRLTRADVAGGAELMAGVAGAAYSMDPALLGEVLAVRRWRRVGRVRSRRGHGRGALAVVLRDADRTLRSPRRLVAVAVGVLVPVFLTRFGLGPAVPLTIVLGAAVVASAMAGMLRRVERSDGLARWLPLSDRDRALTLLVVPGALTLVWAGAATLMSGAAATTTMGAGTVWTTVALAATLAGLAAAVRSARRPAADAGAGATFDTPLGPLPIGMLRQLVRGPDVLIVAVLPLLLGAGPALAVGLPAAALIGTVGYRPRSR